MEAGGGDGCGGGSTAALALIRDDTRVGVGVVDADRGFRRLLSVNDISDADGHLDSVGDGNGDDDDDEEEKDKLATELAW